MNQRDVLSPAQWLQLFSMATAGDPAAENLIFDRLRRRMVRLAARVMRTTDVDDVVQDVLVVVHRKYRRLVVEVNLQDEAAFDRWCRRILHYRIGNDLRRRRFESAHRLPAECLLTLRSVDTPDRLCEASERRELLLRALRHLTAAQRSILYGTGVSSRPAGQSSNSRDARYARIYRARKALWQALQLESDS